MKSLLKGNIFFMVRLLIKKNPFAVPSVILLKMMFILFQVSSIWLLISWIGGNVIPIAKNFLGVGSSSFIYPVISSCLFILSAVALAFSRYVGLQCIGNLELFVSSIAGGDKVTISDYKSLTKLLLAIIDALTPLFFMLCVIIAWAIIYPLLIPFIFFLFVMMLLLVRKGVGFSAKKLKSTLPKVGANEYIGSGQYVLFRSILMLPQYIIVVVYSAIAIFLIIFSVFIKNYFEEGSVHGLSFLLVVTALAFLQMKSFVTVLVKLGAYNSSAAKIAKLLKSSLS